MSILHRSVPVLHVVKNVSAQSFSLLCRSRTYVTYNGGHSLGHQKLIKCFGSFCFPSTKLQNSVKGHLQTLKLYSHIIDSLKQTARKKAKTIKYSTYKSVKIRISSRWNPKLGKLLIMSSFLTPTLFTDTQAKIVPKVLPVEIKKQEKKQNQGFLTEWLLWLYETIRLALRALRLVFTFVPIFALYPLTYFGERTTDLWWNILLKGIEFSGPILIKLGQWASTRRDILPDSCCRQFSKLQRSVKPHPWAFTKYQLKKAFGPDWRKIFIKFDSNSYPVGSGCVAQVYKAWMSKDAISDEVILNEILWDMDDDIPDPFEGFHIKSFKGMFGLDEDEEERQKEAFEEWRKWRDIRQKIEQHQEEDFAAEEESSVSDINVLSITETLASEIVNQDEPQREIKEESVDNITEEALEHSLVEAWKEEVLNKSLPVAENPPDDLEGLVPVAVKVLHPSVHSAFRRDLKIMKACASFISIMIPPLKWLSLPQCVDEFAQVMSAQIDLKVEADNLEAFSANFEDIPFIKFPKPLRPFVTQKVLVETFEEGEQMIDFIGSAGEDKPQELKLRLAEIGVDALLKMVFIDNLVHGDLHPGNILVQNNSTGKAGVNPTAGDVTQIMMVDVGCDTFVMDVRPDPNPLRICFLDCGVVSRLTERDLANFKGVFKHVVFGDGESVAELFLDNSEHNCKDPDAFKADMSSLVSSARENIISLAQVDVGVLLQQVLGILLRHQVRLESAFSAVVLAIFVLEGLGRTLDPDMDILERARPVLLTGKI